MNQDLTSKTDDPAIVYAAYASPSILWGAAAIGSAINLSERQAYHRLEDGQIACAKKSGKTWYAPRSALLREFGVHDDAAA